MPAPETLLLFAAATLAITLVPGPAMIYILARGIAAGRRTAVATALGVESASLVFVVATAAGLAAALAASALALAVIRWLGVAYLVFLGVRPLLRGAVPGGAAPGPAGGAARAYREGFLVGISNPKVAVFFLAFLPQFVDPAAGSATAQLLVLGMVFFAVALVLDLGWAMLAGTLAGLLRRRPGFLRRQRFVTGPVYLGLGAYAAVAGGEPRAAR